MVAELADIRGKIHPGVQHIKFCLHLDVPCVQISRIAASKPCHQRVIVNVIRIVIAVLIIGAPKHLRNDIPNLENRILHKRHDLDAFVLRGIHKVRAVAPVVLHIAVRPGHIAVIGKIQLTHLILPIIQNIDHIPHVVVMIMADIDVKIIILLIVKP